jgi:sigma-54 specific flagellar transcriptional regulator A
MERSLQEDTHQWLVPISPELVVSVEPGGVPIIHDVAPRAAMWTGETAAHLIGRSLAETFEEIIPGLAVVVEEVWKTGRPVRDYRLTFTDHAGIERTVLLQATLRPGAIDQTPGLVVLRLEELPARAELLQQRPQVRVFHGMVSRSPTLLKVFRKIEMYGPTDAPVLITGETGTGKELAARAIHACSRRGQKPFIAVNCSALSRELLESELFGHERGAFTGAISAHKGRFERANGGTLFLDEVGEMPLMAQAKLLRVLEEGEIERVGGERPVTVDVRLIAATNVPLELAVQSREFRLDLFHRLAVLRIHMPPLSEHLEDIPALAEHFLALFNEKYGRRVRGFTPEALSVLQNYFWPGNVRELRNVLERVYVETTTEVIGRKAFDEWVQERTQVFPGAWNLDMRHASRAMRPALITPYQGQQRARPLLPDFQQGSAPIEVEPAAVQDFDDAMYGTPPQQYNQPQRRLLELTRQRIVQAYQRSNGNITQAARLLGVHKATLYRHMKTLGLSRAALEAEHKSVDLHEKIRVG